MKIEEGHILGEDVNSHDKNGKLNIITWINEQGLSQKLLKASFYDQVENLELLVNQGLVQEALNLESNL